MQVSECGVLNSYNVYMPVYISRFKYTDNIYMNLQIKENQKKNNNNNA